MARSIQPSHADIIIIIITTTPGGELLECKGRRSR